MTRARDIADIVSGNFSIPAGSLTNAVPADGSITTAKLANDAVTAAKLAAGAAPVTGFRNLLINGDMRIAQRKSGALTVSNNVNEGYSIVDRWALNFNNGCGGAITYDHSTDAPVGFSRSAKLQCSTTNTSFSTHHYCEFRQRIEAQFINHIGYGTSSGKQMTLSWYMKAVSHSHPITVRFRTLGGTTEYYAKSYTPTANWARYTCTIPASATATISNDNSAGFEVAFVIAAASGSTGGLSSDSTAWQTTRVNYRDDIANFLNSTSNIIYFTGCQLEVNETDTATEFDHRPFSDELARCERYFWKTYNYDIRVGLANSGSQLTGSVDSTQSWFALQVPHVQMRDQPTRVIYNPNTGATSSLRSDSNNHPANITGTSDHGGGAVYAQNSSIGTSNFVKAHLTMDAELG